jgi:hypothetical protein
MLGRQTSLVLLAALLVHCLATSGAAKADYVVTTIDYPGVSYTQALGVNNLGQISGTYLDSLGNGYGFFKDGSSYSNFQFPGVEPRTTAVGLNDFGQIVGYDGLNSWLKSGSSYSSFVYPAGGFTPTTAVGINNSGQIVGYYQTLGATHGFLKDGSTYSSIDLGGGSYTRAYGISNTGEIVGTFQDASGFHGFLKNGSSYTTLDVPGATGLPGSGTIATGVNSSGDIVGYYVINLGGLNAVIHGFLLHDSTYFSYDYTGDGLGFTYFNGISDAGQIVGQFLPNAGGAHGLLLTPTPTNPPAATAPEPASLTLLGVGLLGLCAYHWRTRTQGSMREMREFGAGRARSRDGGGIAR